MKRSAGAPFSIWRASALLPAYEIATVWPLADSKDFAAASSASFRLAAAKTVTLAPHAAGAGASARHSRIAAKRMGGLPGARTP